MNYKRILVITLIASAMFTNALSVLAAPQTPLSFKARTLRNGLSPSEVRAVLGQPTDVIAPKNLRANDIDESPEIHYVLTWANPGCSRVEVMFSRAGRVTGWDGGELCVPQKPLPASYSCTSLRNKNYCGR